MKAVKRAKALVRQCGTAEFFITDWSSWIVPMSLKLRLAACMQGSDLAVLVASRSVLFSNLPLV